MMIDIYSSNEKPQTGMRIYKVIMGFSDEKDDKLISIVHYVILNMTDNVNYPSPDPPLSLLQNVLDVFIIANSNTKDNTRSGTASKKQVRAQLEMMLKSLAMHVQLKGKNDPAILLSSGFELHKIGAPVGPLNRPSNFRAKNIKGISGSVELKVQPVPKAKGYLWKYAEMPITESTIWQIVDNSASKITIIGLKKRTDYVFCVAATGSDPTRTFSDMLTFFVL